MLNCSDIQLLYTKFLAVCKYFIRSFIPSRIVTLGQDPYYITPLVKYLLRNDTGFERMIELTLLIN